MKRVLSALSGISRGLTETYRLGGRTLVVAPVLVALAAVPEFVQHVVEIQIGMFTDAAQAHRAAGDPLRWSFGYMKIAGFVLAMLLTTRYWACGGSVRRAVLVPPRALTFVALAIGALLALAFGFDAALLATSYPALRFVLWTINWALQMGVTVWLVAALVEDSAITPINAFTRRLPTAALLLILAGAAFIPSQLLHALDHRAAFGRPEPLVWVLMIWDALVVGLMAALVGSALWVGYASGATWQGWGAAPARGVRRLR